MEAELSNVQDTMKFRNRIAGGAIVLLGVYVVLQALSYSLGTPMRMGPGFLPLSLGILMMLFGGLVAFVDDADEEAPSRVAWRPLGLVLAGILGFALLVEPVGLAAATAAIVFLSGIADPSHTWKSLAGLYLVLLSSVYVVFGIFLGIPFQLVSGVI